MHPLLLLLLSLTVALLAGVPISFALLLSSLLVIWSAELPATVMIQQMFTGINAFTLLALPFFFLAGNVMTERRHLRTPRQAGDGAGGAPARAGWRTSTWWSACSCPASPAAAPPTRRPSARCSARP